MRSRAALRAAFEFALRVAHKRSPAVASLGDDRLALVLRAFFQRARGSSARRAWRRRSRDATTSSAACISSRCRSACAMRSLLAFCGAASAGVRPLRHRPNTSATQEHEPGDLAPKRDQRRSSCVNLRQHAPDDLRGKLAARARRSRGRTASTSLAHRRVRLSTICLHALRHTRSQACAASLPPRCAPRRAVIRFAPRVGTNLPRLAREAPFASACARS